MKVKSKDKKLQVNSKNGKFKENTLEFICDSPSDLEYIKVRSAEAVERPVF